MSFIYEQLYNKIVSIIPGVNEIAPGDGLKLKSSGFMDLCVDVLIKEPDKTIISLAHYYKQNGDMVPDPDMEIAIYPDRKMAEALSFQDIYGYREVYPEEGMVNLKAKKDLNGFLNTWLGNLKKQGHKFETGDQPSRQK
jgi:uncharacterized protein YqiB (DUF1249 family)